MITKPNANQKKSAFSIALAAFLCIVLAGCTSESAPIGTSANATTVPPQIETTIAAVESTSAEEKAAAFTPEIAFTTVDAEGNTVTEQDLAGYSLVMLNFWEPWCGPCVSEMPDLQKLYEDYQDKGLLIVGVYSTTSMAAEAAEIVSGAGVTYPIWHYCEAFLRFDTGYVPTTVFLDASGKVVGRPKVGSNSYAGWAEIVESLM